MNNRSMKILLGLFILLSILPIVSAAGYGGGTIPSLLETIGKMGGSGTAFWQTYNTYAYFIDGIIYFTLFIMVAKAALKDKLGKGVPIIMGIILGIGATGFAAATGFKLGSLKWFAGLMLFVVLGVLIFNFLHGIWPNKLFLRFCITILIINILMALLVPDLPKELSKEPTAKIIFDTLTAVAFIGLIISLFVGWKKKSTGQSIIDKSFGDQQTGTQDFNNLANDTKNAETKALTDQQTAANDTAAMNNLAFSEENQFKQVADELQKEEINIDTINKRAEELKELLQKREHARTTNMPNQVQELAALDNQISMYLKWMQNAFATLLGVNNQLNTKIETIKAEEKKSKEKIPQVIADLSGVIKLLKLEDELIQVDESLAKYSEQFKAIKTDVGVLEDIKEKLNQCTKNIDNSINQCSKLLVDERNIFNQLLAYYQNNKISNMTFNNNTYLTIEFANFNDFSNNIKKLGSISKEIVTLDAQITNTIIERKTYLDKFIKMEIQKTLDATKIIRDAISQLSIDVQNDFKLIANYFNQIDVINNKITLKGVKIDEKIRYINESIKFFQENFDLKTKEAKKIITDFNTGILTAYGSKDKVKNLQKDIKLIQSKKEKIINDYNEKITKLQGILPK